MISVVICTYNRKQYLKKAIDSVLKQTLNQGLFELIIVDNNSSDGTKNFVQNKYSNVKNNIKYVMETNQGISYCRNTGIANSNFDYTAFLDDDGIAEPRWLEFMFNIIAGKNEKIACATGDVIPIWEIPRPDWLITDFDIYYSIFQLSKERFIYTTDHIHTPAGCNVIYNKEILLKFGGFNTKLGRKNKNLISGEETLLHKQMIKNGYKLIYIPDIRINHHVHKTRISKKWLLKRYFWGGYTNNIVENLESEQSMLTITKKIFILTYIIIFNIILIPLGLIFKPRFYYLVYSTRISKSLGTLFGLMTWK